ncbi:MAG: sialate O-acetylesterase [Prevotellaceae bacterium]|nr:sialate O-acetylesterase [Prevotellaceae bacterium]
MLGIFAMLIYTYASAEVKLPAFFSSNMVMQQQTDCNIWGWAAKGAKIKISVEWEKKAYTTTADSEGKWKATIKTPSAGGPYTIKISDGKELVLENVMMGELWLCSGQSNMEIPMKGYPGQSIENGNDDVLHSTNNQIRLFTVKRGGSFTPKDDVTGTWKEANPESVREFSAAAYYFGRLLNEILGVPVGLLSSSYGGSACEAWMNPAWIKDEWVKAYPKSKVPTTLEEYNKIKDKNRVSSALYNAQLHPFIGIAMKGAIWYQGEDNYNRASSYADMLSTMVKGWRDEWNIGEFPFYYAQIAPYEYGLITAQGTEPINSAFLREQQYKAETMIPNSGMAVLLDVGMRDCIHPRLKRVAGERLARLALVKTYGIKGITAESPRVSGFTTEGNKIIIGFDRDKMWVNFKGKPSSDNFEVAGEDRVFYPAKAILQRSKVVVSSDKVEHPVAVRYGFKNWVEGDLFCEDLPVSSFRSDEW